MRVLLGMVIVLAAGGCVTTTASQRTANEGFEQLLASQQTVDQAVLQASLTQMIAGQVAIQAQMQAVQIQAMQPPP